MRFCKYCGLKISEDSKYCPGCGKNIGQKSGTFSIKQNTTENNKSDVPLNKNFLVLVGLLICVVIIFLFLFIYSRCDVTGCNNKTISGMNYCYSHKCVIQSCDSMRFSYSNYCYSHYLLYDDESSSYTTPVYSYELKISNVKLSSNSSYTIAEGTITNNSNQTVSYIKIKGSFRNSSGTVLDTDWTYAVSSEGLEPGESCTWKMSVKKNHAIENCSISILDFDY